MLKWSINDNILFNCISYVDASLANSMNKYEPKGKKIVIMRSTMMNNKGIAECALYMGQFVSFSLQPFHACVEIIAVAIVGGDGGAIVFTFLRNQWFFNT